MYRMEEIGHGGAPERDPLPEPASRPQMTVFQSLTVSGARALVSRCAHEAGLDPSRTNDLVLAVNEIASNSVNHAQGWGTLRVWRERGRLICEVADQRHTRAVLPPPVSPEPEQVTGYGLWLAEQLCEQVQVRTLPGGTVVRLHMPLEG